MAYYQICGILKIKEWKKFDIRKTPYVISVWAVSLLVVFYYC